MAQQAFRHKVLKIKLCFESPDTQKKEVNIRNPKGDDWQKNLSSLLSNVQKKFKFLADMDDSEWSLSINDTILDKTDADQLKHILCAIPPVPVIEIVKKAKKNEHCHVVVVHFNEQEFEYEIKEEKEEWDETIFQALLAAIRKQFDLDADADFTLVEPVEDGDIAECDDIDDLLNAFGALEDESNRLHLSIQVTNEQQKQIQVMHEQQLLLWVPPNLAEEDEAAWQQNYAALLNEIQKRYSLPARDIALKQVIDGNECDLVDGDELRQLWHDLVEDEDRNVAEIKIAVVAHKKSNKQHDEKLDEEDNVHLTQKWQRRSKPIVLLNQSIDCNISLLVNNLRQINTELKQGKIEPVLKITGGVPDDADYDELKMEAEAIASNAEQTSSSSSSPPDAYQAWFRDVLNLPEYYELFVSAGYKDFSFLAPDIDEDELINDIGIKKRAHRRKILKEIKAYFDSPPRTESHKQPPPPKQQEAKPKVARVSPVQGAVAESKQVPQNIEQEIEEEEKRMETDESEQADDDKEEELMALPLKAILSPLGSRVGALRKSERETCLNTIRSIKEAAEEEKSALHFTQMLRPICQKERVDLNDAILLSLHR